MLRRSTRRSTDTTTAPDARTTTISLKRRCIHRPPRTLTRVEGCPRGSTRRRTLVITAYLAAAQSTAVALVLDLEREVGFSVLASGQRRATTIVVTPIV